MSPEYFQIGDPVADSPVGSGSITGITNAGYPQVNHVAVIWLRRDDGEIFNPFNKDIPELKNKELP